MGAKINVRYGEPQVIVKTDVLPGTNAKLPLKAFYSTWLILMEWHNMDSQLFKKQYVKCLYVPLIMLRLSVVVLILCCSLVAGGQLTYTNLLVDYDSAVEYKNLKVIPVRKKAAGGAKSSMLSFGKAFQAGKILVSERGTASTENVHWLRVKNNSGRPVFIASGEVVLGGRQDRMITKDTVLESLTTDQYIPVMCVEEGRWSEKEKKFTYASFANPKLRKVLDQSKNQLLVWKEIYAQLDSSNINTPTLAYAAKHIDKKHILSSVEYLRYMQARLMSTDTSIVGFVCMTGDKIIGSDIYDDTGLFADQFDNLISGYIEQAINYGSKNKVPDNDVKKYLDQFLSDQVSQDSFLKKNGKIFRRDGKVFHLTSY
jgi:ARG/rhodanese/phosphatase superfamily protein